MGQTLTLFYGAIEHLAGAYLFGDIAIALKKEKYRGMEKAAVLAQIRFYRVYHHYGAGVLRSARPLCGR